MDLTNVLNMANNDNNNSKNYNNSKLYSVLTFLSLEVSHVMSKSNQNDARQ